MSDQLTIETTATKSGAVECLGLHFESDEARRAYFSEKLRAKLKDPEFRKIEGFPVGSDEDILRLSDPPYYAACPNPFLEDFIRCYGKPYDPMVIYDRKPSAVDVSEGKTDPIYAAHSYHTKVPHKAIMRAILHYTEPGDLVLDGFAGTGMTGVAAQLCGQPEPEFRKKVEAEWKESDEGSPKWGARRAVLGDLAPVATFISANYNLPFDVAGFKKRASQILDDLRDEIGWMYETNHADGRKGFINYTVWSALLSCAECAHEIVFSDEALDAGSGQVRAEFKCPGCGALLAKRDLKSLSEAKFDPMLGKVVQTPKRVPILVNYSIGQQKYEKKPDASDLELIARVAAMPPASGLPWDRMMHVPDDVERWGDEWRAGAASFTHVHHLYLSRASQALARLWTRACENEDLRLRHALQFCFEQAIWGMSVMARYAPTHFSQVNQYFAGHIRVFSQHAECSPWYILDGKLRRLTAVFSKMRPELSPTVITTGDCGALPIAENWIDYIFTDPPFGDSLAYSELNFLIECFHAVFTNPQPEAIVSEVQRKDTLRYQQLMRRCFEEYHRVLKPGRWVTIVFHNSKNAIWNAIQEALLRAGFVIADVRTLDKQQSSFNQAVTAGAVKQDLIISAYKPNGGLEQRFELEKGTEEGVWDFVRTHLRQLPVFVAQKGIGEAIAERQSYLLFDRMVAFHVQRGILVPLSAAEFYEGLTQRFEYRDGMYFLANQRDEYDKKKQTVSELRQLELIVRDEHSAIQWLRQQLAEKPQRFSDIQPQFMRETAGWSKEEQRLELSEILRLNFFCYDGEGEVPVQIRNYLSKNFHDLRGLAKDSSALQAKANDRWYVPDPNKAVDLEKIRERELLKTFEEYRASGVKKIKVPRLEALRAGFKRAWDQRDYAMIVEVAAKIPETILQEDSKLLMFYDNAATRLGVG